MFVWDALKDLIYLAKLSRQTGVATSATPDYATRQAVGQPKAGSTGKHAGRMRE